VLGGFRENAGLQVRARARRAHTGHASPSGADASLPSHAPHCLVRRFSPPQQDPAAIAAALADARAQLELIRRQVRAAGGAVPLHCVAHAPS
jgi:hypothetical protein